MGHACVIGHISIKDTAQWAAYRDQVPATLVPWGAELLLRGRLAAVLSGAHGHADTVVIRFPDLATARAWHDSAAYQALLPLRRQAADVTLLLFEE
ncbi:MAG: DUF1330 domain-containing protein [Rhodocyclaceae bacterium]|nr:DUF1330 domain-containing protein [Rhodocyclaceae bacterium]